MASRTRNLERSWVTAAVDALTPLADPVRAEGTAAYMKHVAPFLGLITAERRSALKAAWAPLAELDEAGVGSVAQQLWKLPEREFQYAACDLIAGSSKRLSAGFVPDIVQGLLISKPWWDTVDSLGSGAISPIVARNQELVPFMWEWLDSGDRWLIRAAIQHQHGLKHRTDFDRLYAMCDPFAMDREFFIAKAIGWALREASPFDAVGVQRFVDDHPKLSAVARREAVRGLARQAR